MWEPTPPGGVCPVSKCSSGMWGIVRAAHGHALAREHGHLYDQLVSRVGTHASGRRMSSEQVL
jgi:hypothetical protein